MNGLNMVLLRISLMLSGLANNVLEIFPQVKKENSPQ